MTKANKANTLNLKIRFLFMNLLHNKAFQTHEWETPFNHRFEMKIELPKMENY